MSPEGWAAIASIVASLCAVATVIVRSRSTNRRVDDAKTSADKAASNTKPVSNGFTKDVLRALDKLQAGQERTEQQLDDVRGLVTEHLQAHATADVQQRPRVVNG